MDTECKLSLEWRDANRMEVQDYDMFGKRFQERTLDSILAAS